MSKPEGIEEAPLFDQADIRDLLLANDAPCVSIYVNTRPETDEKDKNRILYKDRVKEVANSLDQRDMDKHLRQHLADQLGRVGQTEDFWLHQQYGLAVFLSPEQFKVRKLMRSPGDLGVVADSFHLRPLLRATQHWMRYRVLYLALQNVALYECDREGISEVPLHESVPGNMAEVVGRTETAPNRSDGQRTGDDNRDLKQYFQAVDQAIRAHHSGGNAPLLLATLSEYQGLFREVSRNPNLLETGLERNPFHELEQSRLGAKSWTIAEQALTTNLEALVERYRMMEAHGEGAASIELVARSAAVGQVETLLVDEECHISGWVNTTNGRVHYGEPAGPHTDDVIDDIAELVLHADGRIQFLPAWRMPGDTGVAAMLRYPLVEQQATT